MHSSRRPRRATTALLAATFAALIATSCSFASQSPSAGGTEPAARVSAAPEVALPAPIAIPARAARVPDSARPNIVFISTDDQRLDDMAHMPFTRRLLGGSGVTFSEAVSPHPLCCPARAEFVTGQYGQNNGVQHNSGEQGGYKALRDPGNNVARWLDKTGYQTAMVGKYLNLYKPTTGSEAGWDHWNPAVRDVYSFTNTTFYNDGQQVLHTDHIDDVVTAYASNYIREFAANPAPFFVWASNLSPHGATESEGGDESSWSAPVVAQRHRGKFAGVRNPAMRKPSFNTSIVNGEAGSLTARGRWKARTFHQARVESLQTVDEGVRDIVETLRETGELDNTYIVFTSDNGFLLGEHAKMTKNFIFDEALRVPMIVRVPGRTTPAVSKVPVTSVDIAPTIAALAKATPMRKVDGVSFAAALKGSGARWRDTQLIQTGTNKPGTDEAGWDIRGVRTERWTYGRSGRTHDEQLYDRLRDPYELVDLATIPRFRRVVLELRQRTRALKDCSGAGCWRSFGPVPAPAPVPKRR
ncbi:sulfatase family protein [Nocardioides pacificus]